MPRLFFIRDGAGVRSSGQGHEVSVSTAGEVANRWGIRYSEHPPCFGPRKPSAYTDPRNVVLYVDESETGDVFARRGFYLFVGLWPGDAQKALRDGERPRLRDRPDRVRSAFASVVLAAGRAPLSLTSAPAPPA